MQRDKILAAARKQFFDFGYFNTTMSGIAADVGGSKSVIWSHFKSKEELFSAVIDRETLGYHDRVIAILKEDEKPFEVLHRFAEAIIERMISSETLILRRLVGSVLGHVSVGDMVYQRLVRDMESALTAFYARQKSVGVVRLGCPSQAASLTIALCAGSDQSHMLWTNQSIDAAVVQERSERVIHVLRTLYGVSDGTRSGD
ncbi:hypothetical protein SKP52_07940 [Sphingopyxis fribergensis]|uniref:HTH tetR-type domain-containing protein n=1 Tax=Sphingopyxis fribergensis TaxID=1515612 RepID=A0A0A7PKN5_9SPHN|nr:TetR/AcrR family transcriptional regulator [Sphingopyxis fribergensis]AJA08507.1 hypothetical protein SKP52_07940 [Sphingopyxis fribergensis]